MPLRVRGRACARGRAVWGVVFACVAGWWILGGGAAAWAQSSPEAGSLLRQQQQLEERLPERLPEAEEPEAERAPPAPASDATVRLRDVHFTGATGLVAEEALRAVVAEAIGRELDFAGLRALARAVTERLRAEGYLLARAYLPRQDVTEGVLTIAILEGRLEDGNGWRVELDDGARVAAERLVAIAEGAAPSGSAARRAELERALLLMNDLPGVSARSRLEPGAETGTTRVVVTAVEGPLLTGAAWADNYGNPSTGKAQLNGLVDVNDPWGRGDQVELSATASEGVRLARLGYTTPLGASGLRASAGLTRMRYEVVDGDGTAARLEGHSWLARGDVTYPVIRTRALSLYAGIGYDFKSLEDDSNAGELRDKQIHAATLLLRGDALDSLGGGGLTSFGLELTGGDLDLSGNAADEAIDAATLDTQGGYGRLGARVSRLQNLPGNFTLLARASGQLATDNLDPAEEFILGGPRGVRAYPVGEAQGDEGWLASLELRYDFPAPTPLGDLRLYAFADTGHIRLHHDPDGVAIPTATGENDYQLSGAGLGFETSEFGRYSLRAAWAHTIGDNPGRAPDGTDADGRDVDDRFWLQAVIRF